MLTDIEIAQNKKMIPIKQIANTLSINDDEIEFYGNYKAKISLDLYKRLENNKNGKLILVTAINPTPAGEGKTTTSVGLGQAMKKIDKNAIVAIREPSLGPVFGIKGGAAGGGYSQVVPMEDINLHFTGDIHAITAANNLLCALLDNHIKQGNNLNIDIGKIFIRRCMDMNERSLRNIIIGLGGKINGVPREDGFIITVASEVMAILCLCTSIEDLKKRLGKMLVAFTEDDKPVFAKDLNAQGAMAALLKDAIKPNLVQTLEGTPVLMHGGPFANIAHGCNSIMATKLGLKLADYCITEAGFGSDLGAEKFFDIKCRFGGLKPSVTVIVATIRALKYNGGIERAKLSEENIDALKKGIINLGAHIDNMKKFGVHAVVALNKFGTDTELEIEIVKQYCKDKNIPCVISEMFEKGGQGGVELAQIVTKLCEETNNFSEIYDLKLPVKDKIEVICKNIYGAKDVIYTKQALKKLSQFGSLCDNMPVCMAKTQYSLSDNPDLLGKPEDFIITIKDFSLSMGAGFIVAYTGDIMTMPGLPKKTAAENIDIDDNGTITGLF